MVGFIYIFFLSYVYFLGSKLKGLVVGELGVLYFFFGFSGEIYLGYIK